MITKKNQIDEILEFYPETIIIDSNNLKIQLFPKASLTINLNRYPKKPKMTLPKKIQRVLGDYETFIPSFRYWDKLNPPLIHLIITSLKYSIEMIAGLKVHFLDKTIKDICYMAKSSYPKEMFCILRIINGVLSEFVIAPGSEASEISTVFFPSRLGHDNTLIASCHSHPSNNFKPSSTDLRTFRKFSVNIIVGTPYNISSLGAYNLQGHPIPFEIHPFDLFESKNMEKKIR
jgi:proteasome lid subunit RPN8/RPN11